MRRKESIDNLIRVKDFIESHVWHFAKTMPEIPHWFCLRKDKNDVEEFLWFAGYIEEHGVPGEFCGKTYRYYHIDERKYWSMDERPEDCDLINMDSADGESPVLFHSCSMILEGPIERVKEIFLRNNVPLCKSDFAKDVGYVFLIRMGTATSDSLFGALREYPDAIASCSPALVGVKTYLRYCKESLVPVEYDLDIVP